MNSTIAAQVATPLVQLEPDVHGSATTPFSSTMRRPPGIAPEGGSRVHRSAPVVLSDLTTGLGFCDCKPTTTPPSGVAANVVPGGPNPDEGQPAPSGLVQVHTLPAGVNFSTLRAQVDE